MDDNQIAAACKALGDPRRLQIMRALACEERRACDLLDGLGITQPTLSHHMKALCASGLVRSRREGKWAFYRIDCDVIEAFQHAVGALGCCLSAGVASEEGNGCACHE
ncbi:MAG: winged helix-turn-helix transcriptional regulator [Coriobacteriaceae bacterium]|nr:winged helix-turn-helix transcriptional regulator [Coriobacteriaceae bacterium]